MTDVTNASLAGDLVIGAAAISRLVFNDDSPKAVRKTRHLLATKIIPSFKLGGHVAARRSKIARAIERLE
jgi:hypothetical protein